MYHHWECISIYRPLSYPFRYLPFASLLSFFIPLDPGGRTYKQRHYNVAALQKCCIPEPTHVDGISQIQFSHWGRRSSLYQWVVINLELETFGLNDYNFQN